MIQHDDLLVLRFRCANAKMLLVFLIPDIEQVRIEEK
jgi:hypothetical protein